MPITLSSDLKEVFVDLGHCLDAMGEYRRHAVLAGGLLPVVYRYLLAGDEDDRPPLTTYDMDWTVPVPLDVLENTLLDERMRESGFEVWSTGTEEDKAFFYKHEKRNPGKFSPIHVEFLASLPEADAAGIEGAKQLEAQDRLKVQALRYVELLFENPITVTGAQVPDLNVATETEFRIAHPATYIVQKVLARPSRRSEKQEKDLAHVYDVALLYRTRWRELAEVLTRLFESNKTYATWIAQAVKRLKLLFESETSDGPMSVVRVYKDAGYSAITERAARRLIEMLLNETGLGSLN
jgi:hypothetical protein